MRSDPSAAWMQMWRTAPGRSVSEVEDEYRELVERYQLRGVDDYAIELTARVMVDPRWGRHHPLRAVAFAWRYRKRQPPVRTLRAIFRPRFAG